MESYEVKRHFAFIKESLISLSAKTNVFCLKLHNSTPNNHDIRDPVCHYACQIFKSTGFIVIAFKNSRFNKQMQSLENETMD